MLQVHDYTETDLFWPYLELWAKYLPNHGRLSQKMTQATPISVSTKANPISTKQAAKYNPATEPEARRK